MNLYASITATYPEDTKEYKLAQKILRYYLQLQGMKSHNDFQEEKKCECDEIAENWIKKVKNPHFTICPMFNPEETEVYSPNTNTDDQMGEFTPKHHQDQLHKIGYDDTNTTMEERTKIFLDQTKDLLHDYGAGNFGKEDFVIKEISAFIAEERRLAQGEIAMDLKVAVSSADNLVVMQNEPPSNQYTHLKDHIRSILSSITKDK